jgi:predicted AAA+ superfamily ATPase
MVYICTKLHQEIMELNRTAYAKLQIWKNSPSRKPLLIRGARQVGKTTLVRQFAREFDHYLELNLERDREKSLFELDDINKILNAAYLLKGTKVGTGSLLLFIDEIQESPKAIALLRYFFEELPDIYLIAAGSLLEFALTSVASFPVGRISYLYLSPVNFDEYLSALNNAPAIEAMNTVPAPDFSHAVLLNIFHEYALVGGMPEVVANFAEHKDISLITPIYKELWRAYKDDFEKYAQNETERKIMRHIIDSAPGESDRIKFEGFGQSNYRSREVGEALRSLDLANVIRLIYPTKSLSPPVVADRKKRPRLQFLDTGLLNNALSIQAEILQISDMNNLHRGKIAQHLVTQQLISIETADRYEPNFWVREEKDTSSEVDLVYHFGKYIIPIEIKSGKQGKLRSLHQFIERVDHPYAIRMHAGQFNVEKVNTPNGVPYLLMNMPYYLATKIPEYIDYFISNYRL